MTDLPTYDWCGVDPLDVAGLRGRLEGVARFLNCCPDAGGSCRWSVTMLTEAMSRSLRSATRACARCWFLLPGGWPVLRCRGVYAGR